jgi:hypothetical protein
VWPYGGFYNVSQSTICAALQPKEVAYLTLGNKDR